MSNKKIHFGNLSFVLLLSVVVFAREGFANQVKQPDQATLIKSLNLVVDLLEKKDYVTAEEYFYLPPNFKPEMFDALLPGKMISRDGVLAMKKGGEFGTAERILGAKRAAAKAMRVKVPTENCYAMVMKQNEVTCEVLVHWTEGRFKIIDMEDLGKMISKDVVVKRNAELSRWPTGKDPSKKLLLDSLAVLLHHIENGHYEDAKSRVYVPENFPAKEFKKTIERNELSADGIMAMRKIGKYGTAAEVFGQDRAIHFSQRVNVPVEECFGVIGAQGSPGETVEGETMAHWKDGKFKFLRADDIGKLKLPTAAPDNGF